jgi:hypothetical protein
MRRVASTEYHARFSQPFKGPTPARRGYRDRVSARCLLNVFGGVRGCTTSCAACARRKFWPIHRYASIFHTTRCRGKRELLPGERQWKPEASSKWKERFLLC